MKRNLFWLVMGGLAVGWVVAHKVGPPPPPPPVLLQWDHLPPGLMVVHEDGRRIVVRDERGRDFEANDDRETVDGLPLPVIRDTRTTDAKAEPPKPAPPPKRPRHAKRAPALYPAATPTEVSITGLRSATPERARRSVREQFERSLVSGVLKDSVPPGWHAPDPLLDRMIREVNVAPIVRDYGTVYEATLKAQLSPRDRDDVIRAYRQQEVRKRMVFLGVILALVLIALAVISGYIKADEATKGYYTARLRAVAVAVVGAGAALLYVKYLRS